MALTSFILDVLTWLSLGVVGLLAIAQVRDLLLQYGFVRRNGWLGRQASRGQASQVVAGLEALGLDDRVAGEIRAMLTPPRRATKRLLNQADGREDLLFLAVAKAWVYKLSAPYNYKGSRYYLDIMGAMADRSGDNHSLDQIFAQWITRAASMDGVEWVDAFLAPKDGNVALCQAVAERFNRPLILCKGDADKALVDRADPREPHETDFEGLRAFIESVESKASLHGRRYAFWVIDDSCSRGSQIASLVRRFNRWLELRSPQMGWDVAPIDRAFVLFRATARGVGNEHLKAAGLSLHALASLGENELKLLRKIRPHQIANHLSSFKLDAFACSTSITMLGPAPAGTPVVQGTRMGRGFGLVKSGGPLGVVDIVDKGVADSEVRVAVTTVGLAERDIRMMQRQCLTSENGEYPAVLGRTFAGVVSDVGTAVRDFALGDSVFGASVAGTPEGALREYVTISMDGCVLRLPQGVRFHEAVVAATIGSLGLRAADESGLGRGDQAIFVGPASPVMEVVKALLEERGIVVDETTVEAFHPNPSGAVSADGTKANTALFLFDHASDGLAWDESRGRLITLNTSICEDPLSDVVCEPGSLRLADFSPTRAELREIARLLEAKRLSIPLGRDVPIDIAIREIESGQILGIFDVVRM